MKTRELKQLLPLTALAGALLFSGCADKNKNGVPDSFAKDAGDRANAVLDEGKKRAAEVGKKLEADTKPVLQEAQKSLTEAAKHPEKTAANVSAAATITPKVKTAIFANDSLRNQPINVSTIGSSKTILLTGSVKSIAQRVLASRIALQSGSGYKVQNRLKVTG